MYQCLFLGGHTSADIEAEGVEKHKTDNKLFIFSTIIKRTVSSLINSPIPAACECTILRCNVSKSSTAMRVFANNSKPVFMP